MLYIMEKKRFCLYYLQYFSTKEVLKRHTKGCFKINGKQKAIISKKAGMLNSKVMNFINNMIEESKYCSGVIKKINKELVITKEVNKTFKNSTKC